MLSPMDSEKALRKFFDKHGIGKLDELFQVLETQSRMSVFRRLKALGYLSSFTHGGRYYTLSCVPDFDDMGLWFHREVGFSRAGTLKETIFELVEDSSGGMTPKEMRSLLKLPASNALYNTLHELTRDLRLQSQKHAGFSLYVSSDADRAAEQLRHRKQTDRDIAEMLRVATDEEVVEVLAEALRAAPVIPEPAVVARRLVARGILLEPHHVEQVYEAHGLVPGKKTPGHNSRRSRR